MKTLMSHHFPPLPIEINYNFRFETAKPKDFVRMLTRRKLRGRIRGITFVGRTADLNKYFKVAVIPFPALESLDLRCIGYSSELVIPDTFLRGSNLHLRSLKLHCVCVSATSHLLTSAPALTKLSLGIVTARDSKSPMLLFLTCLQSMPCLRRLELDIPFTCDEDPDMHWPKVPKYTIQLAKLTSFQFFGPSEYLNTLMAGFSAPSIQDVDIRIRDSSFECLPSTSHLHRFIDGLGEDYHAIQVVLERSFFELSLLTHLGHVGHQASNFRLRLGRFDELSIYEWIMGISNAFSARLATIEELSVVVPYSRDWSDIAAWHTFFHRLPSVKLLRLECTDSLRIASLFHQDHGEPDLAFMPALEEIVLRLFPSSIPKNSEASGVVFQQFISSRQRANHPVKFPCAR